MEQQFCSERRRKPEDKLPVLKAKDGYGQKKQRNQLKQMIQNLYQVQQNWMISLKTRG